MSDIRKYMKDRNNIDDDDVDEVVLEKRLKRHKQGKLARLLLVLALLAAAIIGYWMYLQNRMYSEYEVTDTVEINDSYNSEFFKFGDYMLRYSEDGLAYLNGDETYWNQAFQMEDALMDICEDYVAIADKKGNEIYICDTEELQGKVETEYPIMDMDVSSNGIVAVISGDESDVSHIEVINKDGTKIAKGQTVLSGQGCPVDLSISQDGTKLVVSYLYVGSGVIQSKVVFYNYSEVGKNEVDRFVGGFDYDKTMMAKVEFITNDIVAVFGDDKVVLYSMKQKPSIIAEIEITNEIQSIFYSDSYVGLVLKNNEAEKPYTMAVYDVEGNKVSETKFNLAYKDIKLANKSIVIYNDTRMQVYTVKGKLKYEGDIDEGITSIIVDDNDYSYHIVGTSSIQSIKLK